MAIKNGDAGNNKIIGTADSDELFGKAGNDELFGLAGRDKLDGGRGDDTLEGGAGADELRGGGGADTFVFKPGSGRDIVFDFQDDVDTIVIDSAYGFDSVRELLKFCSSSGGDSAIDLSRTGADAPRIILLGVDNFRDLADDIVII